MGIFIRYALAILAFVLSAIALIRACRADRRSHSLQKRFLEIAEAKEQDRVEEKIRVAVSARIERTINTRGMACYVIRIKNIGAANARDVNVKLDGGPVVEHKEVLKGPKEISLLQPNEYEEYPLALSLKSPHAFLLEVTWSDDSDEPGYYQKTLTW